MGCSSSSYYPRSVWRRVSWFPELTSLSLKDNYEKNAMKNDESDIKYDKFCKNWVEKKTQKVQQPSSLLSPESLVCYSVDFFHKNW